MHNVHKSTGPGGGGAYDTISKFNQDHVSFTDTAGSHVPHDLDDAIINRDQSGSLERDLAKLSDPSEASKLPGQNDIRMMPDQLGKKQAKDKEIEADDEALLAQKEQEKKQQAENKHNKHAKEHHGHVERAGEVEDRFC